MAGKYSGVPHKRERERERIEREKEKERVGEQRLNKFKIIILPPR
jgi:hypothetical protein